VLAWQTDDGRCLWQIVTQPLLNFSPITARGHHARTHARVLSFRFLFIYPASTPARNKGCALRRAPTGHYVARQAGCLYPKVRESFWGGGWVLARGVMRRLTRSRMWMAVCWRCGSRSGGGAQHNESSVEKGDNRVIGIISRQNGLEGKGARAGRSTSQSPQRRINQRIVLQRMKENRFHG